MGISLRRRCFSNAILASPSTLRLYLSAEGHNKIVEVLLENRAAVRGVYSIAAMYSIQVSRVGFGILTMLSLCLNLS
ncbi:unnamed protein product [Microthlaspi erraticum]|uniref:Uncharacterized protein n=1 Tax=Microthlaspi erraticum TaxID=1685480 RepID=A0A6D2LQW3_9BRAS|nr:unnamed protein product [Microthlaspi erraticum]